MIINNHHHHSNGIPPADQTVILTQKKNFKYSATLQFLFCFYPNRRTTWKPQTTQNTFATL